MGGAGGGTGEVRGWAWQLGEGPVSGEVGMAVEGKFCVWPPS